jgi:hypothetical protein
MSSTGADRVAAGAAVVSMLCAGFAGWVAYMADKRVDQQQRIRIAETVEIEEAPPVFQVKYAKSRHGSAPWRVLRNGSSQQIHDVWIQLTDNTYTQLMDVGPCNLYALPPGHFPKAVYFDDGKHTWKRQYNKWPEQTKVNPKPTGQRLTSPWGPELLGSC